MANFIIISSHVGITNWAFFRAILSIRWVSSANKFIVKGGSFWSRCACDLSTQVLKTRYLLDYNFIRSGGVTSQFNGSLLIGGVTCPWSS